MSESTLNAPPIEITGAPAEAPPEPPPALPGPDVFEARADADRRLDLLKSLEWTGERQKSPLHVLEPTCPKCHGRKDVGHTETCALKLEIG